MYFGEANTSVDEKGRITVSRKFRETMDVLGHLRWYMTRGFDGSLFLFPKEEWDKIRSQTAKYPSMDTRALGFRRMLIGSAQESQPDRQGRMVVPQHLREYAGITRDAVLIGVEDHLELWSRERWKAYQESQDEEFKAMAEKLFEPKNDIETVAVG